MQYWAQWRPRAYAAISDPGAFFTVLGEEVAWQVEQLADCLAGEDWPGEGYLDKVARLTSARMVAEELILPHLVTPEPEDKEEP
jgi:hypothetical protein